MKNIKLPKFTESKSEVLWLLLISLGVFLFILFFQPFPLNQLQSNNRLIYVLGFWGISFIIPWLALSLFENLIIGNTKSVKSSGLKLRIVYWVLYVLEVTAFLFYIYFVGQTHLSLYTIFKATLVCLMPILVLSVAFKNNNLEKRIFQLESDNLGLKSELSILKKGIGEEVINLYSGNKAEKLPLKIKDIVLIRSADNYVEVFFKQDGKIDSKLMRNTLKDIEQQLNNSECVYRCHRMCLVNILYVKTLNKTESGYQLIIPDFEEKIPVSKQYLSVLRETIR